jgi:hypothetical protein
MKRFAVVFVLATALVAGPLAGAATKPPDYAKLTVKLGKRRAAAMLGTYYHPTADGKVTSHIATYPLNPGSTVTIRRGGRVDLLLGANASYVTWRAVRIDSEGKEKLTASGEARPAKRKAFKTWRVKLPRGLSRATTMLGFNVHYPYAFSDFEIRAKVAR